MVIQHEVTEVVSYKLYNIEGKLMDEFNLSEFGENLILKTSSLPPGIYNLIGMNVKGNFILPLIFYCFVESFVW